MPGETEIAYIAGLFDGEGSIHIKRGLEKKKKTLYMESDGKNIVFFVKYKRHTEEGIKFYINLFQVLIESLQIENINE